MYQLNRPDLVWNRACEGGGISLLPGDRALAALLAFHSLAMNGGVLHACECLGAKELSASEAGYRFFGFNSVGDLLNRARRVAEAGKDLEAHEAQLDREYAALIPSDSHIAEPFEIYFCANPGDFAPR